MAAGSCRPAGGSLSAPPDPLAAIWGPTSKGMGGGGRGEGKEEGRERGRRRGWEGRRGERKREGKGEEGGKVRHTNPNLLPAPLNDCIIAFPQKLIAQIYISD